LPN
jgi:hypothetical protein